MTVPRDCSFFLLIFLPHVNEWFKHKSTCAGEFYSVVKCKLKVKEISTSWSLTTLLRNFNIPGWNRSLTEFVHLSVSLKAATVTLCTCLSLKRRQWSIFCTCLSLKRWQWSIFCTCLSLKRQQWSTFCTCLSLKIWQRSLFILVLPLKDDNGHSTC